MSAPQQSPGAISVSDVWDLHADPAALEGIADQWRSLGTGARKADDTVRGASGRVLADGSWTGDAADSYGTHRDKLVRSLDQLGELTDTAAEGLDAAAYVLRTGQSQLDSQFLALTNIMPASRGEKDVSFQPADQAQADLVTKAISEAREVRDWVDERLGEWARKLRVVDDDLASLGRQWPREAQEPRSVRMLDLNMGRGKGNSPRDPEGVEDDELDEIARIILDNDADVVTLQEVYEGDLGHVFGIAGLLERETGDRWDVVYTEADHKLNRQNWDNLLEPPESFGNAILVRHGEVVEGATEIADVQLQEPGNLGVFNVGEEGRSIAGARIELADE